MGASTCLTCVHTYFTTRESQKRNGSGLDFPDILFKRVISRINLANYGSLAKTGGSRAYCLHLLSVPRDMWKWCMSNRVSGMLTEIVPFLTKHWLLASSFVVVLGLFIWHEYLYRQQTESYSFNSEQLVLQMNHNLVQVIDIRSPELHQAGCILGSVHVDAETLEKKAASLHKKSPAKVIVLIGEMGREAAALADKIRTEAMPVRYLSGGMQAWREAQLPTVKNQKK